MKKTTWMVVFCLFVIIATTFIGSTAIAEELHLDQSFLNLKVGESILIGHYEQDGNDENLREPIEWNIISIDNKKNSALVVAQYGLEALSYGEPMNTNEYLKTGLNWDNSYIRGWLRDTFYANAFSDEEKSRILLTKNSTSDKSGKYTTEDKVFLLSASDVKKYMKKPLDMACKVTEHAKKGLKLDSGALTDEGYCLWWLRDMLNVAKKDKSGNFMKNTYNEAGFVYGEEGLKSFNKKSGAPVFCDYLVVVRPAMWIQLDDLVSKLLPGEKTITLNVGESKAAGVTVLPESAAIKVLKWTSEDTSIATVDTNGIITGKKCGSTKINAVTTDGTNLKISFDVNIPSFSVDIKEIAITTPNSVQLHVVLNGIDSNELVISTKGDCFNGNYIDKNGDITISPKKPGRGTLILSHGKEKNNISIQVTEDAISIFDYVKYNMSEKQRKDFFNNANADGDRSLMRGVMLIRHCTSGWGWSDLIEAIESDTLTGYDMYNYNKKHIFILGIAVDKNVIILLHDSKKDDFRATRAGAHDEEEAKYKLEEVMDNLADQYPFADVGSLSAYWIKKDLEKAAQYAGWHY